MPKWDILRNFQTMWIRLGTILVIDAVHVFKAVSRGVLAFKAKKSVFCTGYWSMTDDDIKRTRNTEAEYMSADFLTYSISIQFFVQSTYPTSCLLLGTVSVCYGTHTYVRLRPFFPARFLVLLADRNLAVTRTRPPRPPLTTPVARVFLKTL